MKRAAARAVSQAPAAGWPILVSVSMALIGLLASQYIATLALPFINDDYLIFGKLHSVSLISLWVPRDLLSGFYRPWSRELHFWVLAHLFGTSPMSFHLANFVLWLAAMGLFFVLVRKLAGTAVASLATCLAATQAAWGVPLIWASGSQDLWMICAGLAFLVAYVNGRTLWSTLALAIALLSKETAATLPAIAVLYSLLVERRSARDVLQRTAPFWPIVIAWALVHPMLAGRIWHPSAAPGGPGHWNVFATLAATLSQLVNADVALRPAEGWGKALLVGLPGAGLLTLAVVMGFQARAKEKPSDRGEARGERREARGDTSSIRAVSWWGLSWAALGWLPFLAAGPGWHAYYCLWGAFGVWLAIALVLGRYPRLAIALLIALALLRPARAMTPQVDLGSEWYHLRAAELTRTAHDDLLLQHTSFPHHSRIYLALMPGGVGLVASPGYSPTLQAWYADWTLRGYFNSQYAPRTTADTLGSDFFFKFDSTGHAIEIIKGAEDLSRARTQKGWLRLHGEIATLLFLKHDPAGAIAELEKMASAFPDEPYVLYSLGVCREFIGDRAGAEQLYRRASSLPGASEQMLRQARQDWTGRL